MKMDATATTNTTASCKWLRICFWCAALALGAADAWATRFTMNPDGISYLDMGDAYLRGDWHMAINAYWSPLYSWILGLFLKVLRPPAYWEYPIVHLVNFLIYMVALGCFEFFLYWFIRSQPKQEGEKGLPEWAWWTLGYALFTVSSVLLIGLGLVSPDMAVAAMTYLLAGFLLRIRCGNTGRCTFLILGMALALGYFAKTVMFPIGLVFLGVAAYPWGKRRTREFLPALIVAGAISTPFIAAISLATHHLTIGESARWNYLVFVNGVRPFYPQGSAHPPHSILDKPVTYEFSDTVDGTFPPWFHPSYWQTGIKPRVDLEAERRRILLSGLIYTSLFFSPFLLLSTTLGYLILVLIAPQPAKCLANANWSLLVVAVSAMCAYAVLLVEYRYVAPFVCLFSLACFSGVSLPTSLTSSRIVAAVVLVIATTLIASSVRTVISGLQSSQPTYQSAAAALRNKGIREGDRLALLWKEDWNHGAVEGAFVPRLLKAKIVAEVIDPSGFWNADAATRTRVFEALRKTGAKAILTRDAPASADGAWEQIGGTDYYVHMLLPETARAVSLGP